MLQHITTDFFNARGGSFAILKEGDYIGFRVVNPVMAGTSRGPRVLIIEL